MKTYKTLQVLRLILTYASFHGSIATLASSSTVGYEIVVDSTLWVKEAYTPILFKS